MAALGTVVAWTPVLAQTANVQPTDDTRHLTITPVVVTTYDTNIARADAAYARMLHLTQEDVLVQPSVAVDALLPVSREALFVTGDIGYDYYGRNTVLDRERIDLAGGASAHLFNCLPQLTGTYARHQMQLEQLLPGPGAPIAAPQNVSTQAGVGFQVSCPRTIGLFPTFSVNHSTYSNSDKLYRATDSTSNSGMAGLSYARPALGVLQVYGNYTSVTYAAPFIVSFPPFQLKNDYNLYAGGLRYDRPISSRLTGSVSVSYSSLRPSISAVRGFSGLTYNAELAYNLSSRLKLHGLISRSTLPSNQVGAAFLIDQPEQVDLSYSLGARLTFTVGGYQDHRTYQGGFANELPDVLTSERTQRIFGSASFNVSRRLSVELNAADEHRNANVALYNYTSNRISLTLKSVF